MMVAYQYIEGAARVLVYAYLNKLEHSKKQPGIWAVIATKKILCEQSTA